MATDYKIRNAFAEAVKLSCWYSLLDIQYSSFFMFGCWLMIICIIPNLWNISLSKTAK